MKKLRLPCETFAKNVLPIFRSLVAYELVRKHGLTQAEAAKKMGTTQAAISQYINSKRGNKCGKRVEHVLPKLESVVSDIGGALASERMSGEEIVSRFCKICIEETESVQPCRISKSNVIQH